MTMGIAGSCVLDTPIASAPHARHKQAFQSMPISKLAVCILAHRQTAQLQNIEVLSIYYILSRVCEYINSEGTVEVKNNNFLSFLEHRFNKRSIDKQT